MKEVEEVSHTLKPVLTFIGGTFRSRVFICGIYDSVDLISIGYNEHLEKL